MEKIAPLLIAARQEQFTENIRNPIRPEKIYPKQDNIALNSEKSDKKKLITSTTICLTAFATATGMFFLSKKGVFGANLEKLTNELLNKIKSIFHKTKIKSEINAKKKPEIKSDTEPKIATNITKKTGIQSKIKPKFKPSREFLCKNNPVEGVQIIKGRAINSDKSGFTGVMSTETKSGKKVTVEYKDGFIVNSKIDGKMLKRYARYYDSSTKCFLARDRGVIIEKLNESGKIIERNYRFYHENGNISKIIKCEMSNLKDIQIATNNKCTEFLPNGQKIAEFEFNYNHSIPKRGKIFDKNGNIKKEFFINKNNKFCERTYNSNGSYTDRIGSRYKIDEYSELLSSKELVNAPKEIKQYNQYGDLVKHYMLEESQNGVALTIINPQGKIFMDVGKISKNNPMPDFFDIEIHDKENLYQLCLSPNSKSPFDCTKNCKKLKEKLSFIFCDITKILQEMKNENMTQYFVNGSNISQKESYDSLENCIKLIEKFLLK
ncbi:hypothetical protein IJG72_02500 [bacterium]|nr:hypothetical protein [bacterium]